MLSKKRKSKKKENKKVKNATPIVIDGIQFRSKLEGYVYTELKKNKLKADYEPIAFELMPAFQFKDKKLRRMTYTPDFVGSNFIIEAKGRPNDVFPYKWKWFMYYLKSNGLENKFDLYIVHNHKETDECIKRIKTMESKNILEEYDIIIDLGPAYKKEEKDDNDTEG